MIKKTRGQNIFSSSRSIHLLFWFFIFFGLITFFFRKIFFTKLFWKKSKVFNKKSKIFTSKINFFSIEKKLIFEVKILDFLLKTFDFFQNNFVKNIFRKKKVMSPKKMKNQKSKWIDLEDEKIFWPRVFFIIEIWVGSYRKKLLAVLNASQSFRKLSFSFFSDHSCMGSLEHLPGEDEVLKKTLPQHHCRCGIPSSAK